VNNEFLDGKNCLDYMKSLMKIGYTIAGIFYKWRFEGIEYFLLSDGKIQI